MGQSQTMCTYSAVRSPLAFVRVCVCERERETIIYILYQTDTEVLTYDLLTIWLFLNDWLVRYFSNVTNCFFRKSD